MSSQDLIDSNGQILQWLPQALVSFLQQWFEQPEAPLTTGRSTHQARSDSQHSHVYAILRPSLACLLTGFIIVVSICLISKIKWLKYLRPNF